MQAWKIWVLASVAAGSIGVGCPPATPPEPWVAPEPPERLFLQQVGPHSAIIKWREGADQACYAKEIGLLEKLTWPNCVPAIVTETGHKEAHLTNLAAEQTYYYILGRPGPTASDPEQHFRTPPSLNKPPSDDGNVHIWLIGDSGTETEESLFGSGLSHPGEATEVKEGFLDWNATREPVDLFVLLGDNAYLDGTDAQWQGAFFDVYPEIMKQAQVLPTIGNHVSPWQMPSEIYS